MTPNEFCHQVAVLYTQFHQILPAATVVPVGTQEHPDLHKFNALVIQLDRICRGSVGLCQGYIAGTQNDFSQMPHIYIEGGVTHVDNQIGEIATPDMPRDVIDYLLAFAEANEGIAALIEEFRASAH